MTRRAVHKRLLGAAALCVGVGLSPGLLAGEVSAANAAVVSEGQGASTVVAALADGEGRKAARLIHGSSLRTDPEAIGQVINQAGTRAVRQGTGDRYRDAVAVGFTRGGVPLKTATLAFASAGADAVAAGLTPEQALVGGTTMLQTYEAYAFSLQEALP